VTQTNQFQFDSLSKIQTRIIAVLWVNNKHRQVGLCYLIGMTKWLNVRNTLDSKLAVASSKFATSVN